MGHVQKNSFYRSADKYHESTDFLKENDFNKIILKCAPWEKASITSSQSTFRGPKNETLATGKGILVVDVKEPRSTDWFGNGKFTFTARCDGTSIGIFNQNRKMPLKY